ncbi:hypothetical protein HOY80DRAFT_331034 [Tuber brumale]|nr:hypothetical protein HOY80DRAFT_331034 [Tuber brumale]
MSGPRTPETNVLIGVVWCIARALCLDIVWISINCYILASGFSGAVVSGIVFWPLALSGDFLLLLSFVSVLIKQFREKNKTGRPFSRWCGIYRENLLKLSFPVIFCLRSIFFFLKANSFDWWNLSSCALF